jgi:predicted amidohydrolase
MEGPTLDWMRERAGSIDAAICGSVQIRTEEGVFNRLMFVKPDGKFHTYDKRHLFRYAREHERYASGRDRLTVEWKGWRICPLVCYDLRFPVFSRNRFNVEREGMLDYDLLIYVANWPSARSYPWKTLLRATARSSTSWAIRSAKRPTRKSFPPRCCRPRPSSPIANISPPCSMRTASS